MAQKTIFLFFLKNFNLFQGKDPCFLPQFWGQSQSSRSSKLFLYFFYFLLKMRPFLRPHSKSLQLPQSLQNARSVGLPQHGNTEALSIRDIEHNMVGKCTFSLSIEDGPLIAGLEVSFNIGEHLRNTMLSDLGEESYAHGSPALFFVMGCPVHGRPGPYRPSENAAYNP